MKVYDGLMTYTDPNGKQCAVRHRMYETDGALVSMMTDLEGAHAGMSLTNSIEQAAGAARTAWAERVEDNPEAYAGRQTVFIEHYPQRPAGEETFDLVKFCGSFDPERVAFSGPSWRRLQRGEVEGLIGEALMPETFAHQPRVRARA